MTRVPLAYYFFAFVILLVANVLVYREIWAPPALEIRVFEVGKADKEGRVSGRAVLLRTPEHKTILINTGPDASILRDLGTSLPPWQRRIDAVILTSTKSSFAAGLKDVRTRYHISRTLSSHTRYSLGSGIILDISAPDAFSLSYASTVFDISSSTPPDRYVSDGTSFYKK